MKTTMCRWCGGEMRIKFTFICNSVTLSSWVCENCHSRAGSFEGFSEVEAEAEALAWAQQPIPFLPEKLVAVDAENPYRDGYNKVINQITSALGVKTTEQ